MKELFACVLLLSILAGCTTEAEPPALPDIPPAPDIPPVPEDIVPVNVQRELEPQLQNPVDVFRYPTLGKDAMPTITVYGDFGNMQSSQFAFNQFQKLKRDYVTSNKAQILFRPMATGVNPHSARAAEASLCIWEQGESQFWKYHDTLFQYSTHLDNQSLHNYVGRVPNVDKIAFTTCLASGKYQGIVVATTERAFEDGIEIVPAVVAGGSIILGAQPYKDYQSAVAPLIPPEKSVTVITGNIAYAAESGWPGLRRFFKRVFTSKD
jgi:protein-disulfide isomerase